MYDFHSFFPLPGERFPRCRPSLSMATPVPERMQDRYGRVYRYVGPIGQPLTADQILVFPGHVYERERGDKPHAH